MNTAFDVMKVIGLIAMTGPVKAKTLRVVADYIDRTEVEAKRVRRQILGLPADLVQPELPVQESV